jgi:hypothetical protein
VGIVIALSGCDDTGPEPAGPDPTSLPTDVQPTSVPAGATLTSRPADGELPVGGDPVPTVSLSGTGAATGELFPAPPPSGEVVSTDDFFPGHDDPQTELTELTDPTISPESDRIEPGSGDSGVVGDGS